MLRWGWLAWLFWTTLCCDPLWSSSFVRPDRCPFRIPIPITGRALGVRGSGTFLAPQKNDVCRGGLFMFDTLKRWFALPGKQPLLLVFINFTPKTSLQLPQKSGTLCFPDIMKRYCKLALIICIRYTIFVRVIRVTTLVYLPTLILWKSTKCR